MSKAAGYALIAAGFVVIALGAFGAAGSGDDAAVASPTGATPGTVTGTSGPATGASGVTTGPTGETAPEVETPQVFLASFAQAIREGDVGFLFVRLHPVVVDFYGASRCRAAMRTFSDPEADFGFIATSEPGEYQWVVDGASTSVEDVLSVTVTQVSVGEESERDIHLGIVDRELRWFTDCGDPA